MNRFVLDINVVVSAPLAPAGTEATVLMLAYTGHVTLYVSTPALPENDEVLRRPHLKLDPPGCPSCGAGRDPGCLA